MDATPSFSIGTASLFQKLADQRRRDLKRRKDIRKSRASARRYILRVTLQIRPIRLIHRPWLLIPTGHLPFNVRLLLNRGTNLQEVRNYIKSKRPRRRFYNAFYFHSVDDLVPNASDYLLGIKNADVKEANRIANLNESVRRSLGRLAVKWIRSKMSRANEEDLITMEAPLKEVVVCDWAQRKSYHFEASTLLRCIVRRITNHDVLFITPLDPVNPYTNIPFSLGNMHSISDQLRAHGLTHWTIEALRSLEYDWCAFKNIHEKALQTEALKKTFIDTKNADTRDLVYDFIESEYSINDIEFEPETYRWAITHSMETPHIEIWYKLCYTYYATEILYKDIPLKGKLVYAKALAIAVKSGIFHLPLYLTCRMMQWKKSRAERGLAVEVGADQT